MNTTVFKGFTIRTEQTDAGDRHFILTAHGSTGFRFDGYASLGNAKGAITKHLNANDKPAMAADADDADYAVTTLAEPKAEPMTGDLSQRFDSLAVGDKFMDECLPGHVMTKQCNETASSDLHNNSSFEYAACEQVFKERRKVKRIKATPSRNKREGKMAGRLDGRIVRGDAGVYPVWSATSDYYVPTRKAKKRFIINYRNDRSQIIYGGRIQPKEGF